MNSLSLSLCLSQRRNFVNSSCMQKPAPHRSLWNINVSPHTHVSELKHFYSHHSHCWALDEQKSNTQREREEEIQTRALLSHRRTRTFTIHPSIPFKFGAPCTGAYMCKKRSIQSNRRTSRQRHTSTLFGAEEKQQYTP